MPVINFVANLRIRYKWLISTTKFGKQAGMPYYRCGRTKAPFNWMKVDFDLSFEKRSSMKINNLA